MSEQKQKTIYISGKITDLDINVAKDNFKKAEEFVESEMPHFKPINPFDVCEQKPEYKWIDYMRADIKALVDCDAILMLPDWNTSDGAKLELQIAQGLNMEIYYI